jgi:hypothetical protein
MQPVDATAGFASLSPAAERREPCVSSPPSSDIPLAATALQRILHHFLRAISSPWDVSVCTFVAFCKSAKQSCHHVCLSSCSTWVYVVGVNTSNQSILMLLGCLRQVRTRLHVLVFGRAHEPAWNMVATRTTRLENLVYKSFPSFPCRQSFFTTHQRTKHIRQRDVSLPGQVHGCKTSPCAQPCPLRSVS